MPCHSATASALLSLLPHAGPGPSRLQGGGGAPLSCKPQEPHLNFSQLEQDQHTRPSTSPPHPKHPHMVLLPPDQPPSPSRPPITAWDLQHSHTHTSDPPHHHTTSPPHHPPFTNPPSLQPPPSPVATPAALPPSPAQSPLQPHQPPHTASPTSAILTPSHINPLHGPSPTPTPAHAQPQLQDVSQCLQTNSASHPPAPQLQPTQLWLHSEWGSAQGEHAPSLPQGPTAHGGGQGSSHAVSHSGSGGHHSSDGHSGRSAQSEQGSGHQTAAASAQPESSSSSSARNAQGSEGGAGQERPGSAGGGGNGLAALGGVLASKSKQNRVVPQ